MLITVKYIVLASLLGERDAQSLELPAGSTLAHLLNVILEEKSSSIGTMLRKSTLFVNQVKADRDTVLNDGDQVIIAPEIGCCGPRYKKEMFRLL